MTKVQGDVDFRTGLMKHTDIPEAFLDICDFEVV
jgi:hypothetical protein